MVSAGDVVKINFSYGNVLRTSEQAFGLHISTAERGEAGTDRKRWPRELREALNQRGMEEDEGGCR